MAMAFKDYTELRRLSRSNNWPATCRVDVSGEQLFISCCQQSANISGSFHARTREIDYAYRMTSFALLRKKRHWNCRVHPVLKNQTLYVCHRSTRVSLWAQNFASI